MTDREPANSNPIAELRVKRGLTQPDMAQAMGWKGKQAHLRVSAVETGREWLGDSGLRRMAKVLGVSQQDLGKLLCEVWRTGYLNRRNQERANNLGAIG